MRKVSTSFGSLCCGCCLVAEDVLEGARNPTMSGMRYLQQYVPYEKKNYFSVKIILVVAQHRPGVFSISK